MLCDGFFDPNKPLFIRRGDLPHWRQEGALYFVTFRLDDSLPQSKLAAWRNERDAWLRDNPLASFEEVDQFNRGHRRRIERWLDEGLGSCALRDPEAKPIVESAIRHFEGERYELGEFAVASNHVHALVRTAVGVDLSEVLHSWKRHSAREILKLRRLVPMPPRSRCHFWQTESFDHIVRNELSLEKFSHYIRNHKP